MSSVYQQIYQNIQEDRPGAIYTTKDFSGLTNSTSVGKALSSLVQKKCYVDLPGVFIITLSNIKN